MSKSSYRQAVPETYPEFQKVAGKLAQVTSITLDEVGAVKGLRVLCPCGDDLVIPARFTSRAPKGRREARPLFGLPGLFSNNRDPDRVKEADATGGLILPDTFGGQPVSYRVWVPDFAVPFEEWHWSCTLREPDDYPPTRVAASCAACPRPAPGPAEVPPGWSLLCDQCSDQLAHLGRVSQLHHGGDHG